MSANKAKPHLHRRGKIILMGASMTQMSLSAELSGWGCYLANIYQRRCDVYNRGMTGYNTDFYLNYLESDVGQYDVFEMMKGDHDDERGGDVKLITIFLGANDASSKELNPLHHVPLQRYESNLKTIVAKCRDNFGLDVRIILITPTPICHKSRLEHQIKTYGDQASGKLERTLALSGEYARAVERVCGEIKLPCLNIWKDMQQSAAEWLKQRNYCENLIEKQSMDGKHPWSLLLSDGMHLSREGNLFLGENLVALINKDYPEIAVKPCPHTNETGFAASKGGHGLGSIGGIGPWYEEIDPADKERAFKAV